MKEETRVHLNNDTAAIILNQNISKRVPRSCFLA